MSIVKELANTNDRNYNLTKASEELNELSEVLLKLVNKAGTKKEPDRQDIIDELGDVEVRLQILKEMFGVEECNFRVAFKLNKYETYLKEGRYRGRI